MYPTRCSGELPPVQDRSPRLRNGEIDHQVALEEPKGCKTVGRFEHAVSVFPKQPANNASEPRLRAHEQYRLRPAAGHGNPLEAV